MKFNRKRQPARIILRIDLAGRARVAVKSQNVLSRMEHPGRNRKMRLLVSVPARNPRPQKHAPVLALELTDVAVEASRRDKVEVQKEGIIGADQEGAALFACRVDPS